LMCVRTASAQEDLPLLADDFEFAKQLANRGFEDLAIKVYQRLAAQPDATPKRKQEIGRLMVDAYRALAAKTADLETRSRYLSLADATINTMVKQLGERALTPEFRYKRAQVLQTQGQSIAKAVKEERDAERKQALIAQGVAKLDECAALLEEIAAEMKAKIQPLNPFRQQDLIRPLREVAIKSELQRAWTSYYKAHLYEEDAADYQTNLSRAVQLFSELMIAYPDDMSVLIGRYGRGLTYKLLGKKEEAKEDFGGVVKMIDEAEAESGPIPEVHPLKARCAINWAEVCGTMGEYDEAVAGIDKTLQENPAAKQDPKLLGFALVTKAEVLGAKAAKLKADGDAAAAATAYQQAIKVLGDVIRLTGPYSYEASGLIAKYLSESGIKTLDPESRIALAGSLLQEKKYPEAIAELRKIVDGFGQKATPDVAFKAHQMLALALRYSGDVDQSVKEFESLLRIYRNQPQEELAKAALQRSWALAALAKANRGQRELDKAYVDSLKQLADTYPQTKEGLDARYYYAEALRQRARTAEDFEEAARTYAQVSEKSEHYGRARYLEGLCYYNIFRTYATKNEDKSAEAQKALATSKSKLMGVIDNLGTPASGQSWHVEAARTLAEIHMDLKQPREALGVLDAVAKKYPSLSVADPQMLATRLKVYVAMAQLEEACAIVDELASQKADPSALLRGYLTLGDAHQKLGDRMKGEGKTAEAEKAYEKTRELLKKALPFVPPDDVRVLKWLASKCFILTDYETCIRAIDAIETFYTDSGRKADSQLWRLRILKARCYEAMSHWPPEGLKLLKDIESQYPNVASIKVLRASVYETRREWEEALKIWDEVESGVKPGSPDWFSAKYHRALCNYQLGDKTRGNEVIDGLKALNPRMGGPEMKKKFEELRDKHN